MSSSSGRRSSPPALPVASTSGQKRARGEDDPGTSLSNPDSAAAPAQNPRRAFSSSPFADFGSYMSAKNSKLAAQFDADAATSAAAPGALFAGVSIFVDGFTVPSSQELKEIMLNNGGRMVNYFSRHTVTHIICTHLPESKMRNMRAFSKGLPVVKPAWVVDSLAENRILSCIPYQISHHSSSSRKQMKLSAFFSGKQDGTCNQGDRNDVNKDLGLQTSSAQEGSQDQNVFRENEGSLMSVEVAEDSLSPDEHEVSTLEERDGEDFAMDDDDNVCETEISESVDNDMDTKLYVPDSPDATSDVCGTNSVGSHLSLGLLEKDTAKSATRSHSTLTDPNFVENYFKHSRLHFIGTWRNRYRKRFSNSLGAKSSKGKNDHSGKKKTIIHIDMDCFFVSVVIRNRPELHDKPVAVCHSDNPKGTAEISSANYPARNYGIKAGMLIRDAKARCPHLTVVPYNFDAYGEVADQFYGILHKYCSKVQALSCDEAFLDMTECLHDNVEEVTERMRNEIFGTTKCTASAGIAENRLLARLATRSAKPNGQLFISSEKADDYLNTLPIKALPGIGFTVSAKLKSNEVEYCGQLRNISKDALHKDFGKKISNMLWNYCRGIDHSVVEDVQETKSVGAEVNWGVRFNEDKDADHFLVNLSKEVSLRLQGCGLQGRTVTLKVKTRRKGAGEPIKFMGCGDCETMSRSTTITGATDNLVTLQRIARQLFAAFHVDVKEVRGVGLKMSKLEHADLARGAPQGNMLKSWLGSSAEKLKKQGSEKTCLRGNNDDAGTSGLRNLGGSRPSFTRVASHSSKANLTIDRSTRVDAVEMPPLSELDLEVLKNLPPEIISEMNVMYKGELRGFLDMISGDEGKESNSKSLVSPAVDQNSVSASTAKLHGYGEHRDSVHLGKQKDTKGTTDQEVQAASASCSRACELGDTNSVTRLDFMPNSLSQADFTVLQELPEDVKADLFNVLPLHRSRDPTCSTSNVTEIKSPNDEGTDDPIHHLPGSCKKWAEQLKVSSSLILNAIAEQHADSISNKPLSSILEPIASLLPLCPNSGSEEWNDTLSCLSGLLVEYIHLKVDSDIEELHRCFLLLKRFSSASELFLELHNSILPLLQDSISQHYGGVLRL
ncbi:DNA repair protein REV1 [Lolium perenne]|uniref:DNA repair protein REV1 n=1 Tax=Lolium perenne TaxID=4522 RepID=UPI0021F54CFE|nr:DNA repair protein REV1 [Lolium perenne]